MKHNNISMTMNINTTTTENTQISGTMFQQMVKTLNFCERAISEQRVKFQQIITEGQQCITQKNIENQQLRHELKLMQEHNEVLETKEQQQTNEVQYLKRVNSQLQTEMTLRKEPMEQQLYTEMNMLREMNEQLKAENKVLGQANEQMQNKYIEWEHMQHFKMRYCQLREMIINTLGLTQTTTPSLFTSIKEQQQQRQQSLPSPSLSITSNHSDEESNNCFLIDIHDMEDQIKNKQRQNDKTVKHLIDMQSKLNQSEQELLKERIKNNNFSEDQDSIKIKSLHIRLDDAVKTYTDLKNQNTDLLYKMNELKIKLDKALNENHEKSKLYKIQQEGITRLEKEKCNLKAENQKIIIEYELTKVALESSEKELCELKASLDTHYQEYYNQFQQYYVYYQQQ